MSVGVLEGGAAALARAIRSRELSCAAVMDATLDRIGRFNPRHNAIVALRDRSALMAEATAADAALAEGVAVGPLHGLPLAVKDVVPVAGVRTTWGSPIFRDFVPAEDAIAVERMRSAGGIVIGKTNVPEFGLGSHTYNPIYGATGNAYDPSRTAGGSSGGAAVAVALRMVPVADGSDFGGSLRNPPGWNNVFGFRPGFGLIPTADLDVWTPSLTVLGPVARSVEDMALLFDVLAVRDDRAPLSSGGSPGSVAALDADIRGRRIAWLGDFGGSIPFEPGVLPLCRQALSVFEELGCVVEDAVPDFPFERIWACWKAVRAWQSGSALVDHARNPATRGLLKPEALFEAESFERLTVEELRQAQRIRTEWYGAVRRFFARYDAFVLPTAQVFPFPVRLDWPKSIAGQLMEAYYDWMKVAVPVSLSGCPAIAAPAGFGDAGLPMGIQIVTPIGRETAGLQLAQAYDRATRWPDRRPPPE